MNHGNGYLTHGGSMQMQHQQHPQHPHHLQAQHHPQHPQHHYQQHYQQHQQMPPQQPPPQMVEPQAVPNQALKQHPAIQIRPKYVEDQEKAKGGSVLQQKEYAKLRENYLKQRFALIVMQRQLHVAQSRLTCALDGLKLAKENKPFHKFYVQAMDEKRHIKGVPKKESVGDKDGVELSGKKGGRKSTTVDAEGRKVVQTKKGDRQRPFKYSTRSKDEMTVISCAADYVVAGTATLREAKDALREMGIFDFETSLSNKMYNHPNKKYYLKMRKEKREEKKAESNKKNEARILRKKNKERENEMKEQRKRAKRQKKQQQHHQQVPLMHEVQAAAHMTYATHPQLQHAVPQMHYAHHDMHRL